MDNNRRAVMKDFLDQQRDYYQPQTLMATPVDYDRREQSFSLADQEDKDRRTRYDFAHEKFGGKWKNCLFKSR